MNIGQLEHVVEVIRFSSFALAAKARHLQDRDSFAIPFFLVCKVGCPPETVELMIAFFREKLG